MALMTSRRCLYDCLSFLLHRQTQLEHSSIMRIIERCINCIILFIQTSPSMLPQLLTSNPALFHCEYHSRTNQAIYFHGIVIISKKQKMTWYMNFCAPFIPNDPTINFHRYFQGALLLLYTIAYAFVHIYYKFWGPDSQIEEEEAAKESEKEEKESQPESIDSSEQQSQKSKEVSIKIDEHANDSCIEMKKSGTTWGNTTRKDSQGSALIGMTLSEIQAYFPIVYGHFAIAMALSIMYTPYAEQSIASLLYMALTIPLMIVNARRYEKSILVVWILMATLLLFIFTCGLLEVGQSNWDFINLTCFSTEYVSLYD